MIEDRVRAIFEAGGVEPESDAKSIARVQRWLDHLPDERSLYHFLTIINARREKYERNNLCRPRSLKYYEPVARSFMGYYSSRIAPERPQDGVKLRSL